MRIRSLAAAGVCGALLVFLMGCGSSSNTSTTPSPVPGGGGGTTPADVTITITGMNGSQSFSPSPASVRAGQMVAWHNSDSITHTATADSGAFSTGNIAAGATSSPIMMSTAGSISYHCSLHPTMTGSLTVQ
jgi:plastocyanin